MSCTTIPTRQLFHYFLLRFIYLFISSQRTEILVSLSLSLARCSTTYEIVILLFCRTFSLLVSSTRPIYSEHFLSPALSPTFHFSSRAYGDVWRWQKVSFSIAFKSFDTNNSVKNKLSRTERKKRRNTSSHTEETHTQTSAAIVCSCLVCIERRG